MADLNETHLSSKYRSLRQASQAQAISEAYTARAIDPSSPAGKKLLRGIPVVGGTSGTAPGTDPLHALLDTVCDCGKAKLPDRRSCRSCSRRPA